MGLNNAQVLNIAAIAEPHKYAALFNSILTEEGLNEVAENVYQEDQEAEIAAEI